MNDRIPAGLRLPTLRNGTPGITPDYGGCLCEAASVCLEHNEHVSGVTMSLTGAVAGTVRLDWDEVSDQARRCWADLPYAAEHGAYGLAVLLIEALTTYTVVERSWKRTGFDFWLGPKDDPTPLFQNKARLEVSGILLGEESDIRGRIKEKLRQLSKGGVRLPGYAVVTEFSRPETRTARP
jgi:hypothetical protein